jgi:voltage-gated potassium channel
MVSGIFVFALWAGILATGFAEETRRRDFLRTRDLVAKVPFFHDIGSSTIADVAGLLRPRDYPAGAVIMRRGEHGDCMYFVASGEVQIRLSPEPIYLGAG